MVSKFIRRLFGDPKVNKTPIDDYGVDQVPIEPIRNTLGAYAYYKTFEPYPIGDVDTSGFGKHEWGFIGKIEAEFNPNRCSFNHDYRNTTYDLGNLAASVSGVDYPGCHAALCDQEHPNRHVYVNLLKYLISQDLLCISWDTDHSAIIVGYVGVNLGMRKDNVAIPFSVIVDDDGKAKVPRLALEAINGLEIPHLDENTSVGEAWGEVIKTNNTVASKETESARFLEYLQTQTRLAVRHAIASKNTTASVDLSYWFKQDIATIPKSSRHLIWGGGAEIDQESHYRFMQHPYTLIADGWESYLEWAKAERLVCSLPTVCLLSGNVLHHVKIVPQTEADDVK